MRPLYKLLVLLPFALVSCQHQAETGRDTVHYVKEIVSGSEARAAKVIADYGKPLNANEIFIAGSPRYSALLAGKFLESDIFDNVRGNQWSDGLKDFAGETFSCISDNTFAPYSGMEPDAIRELAVRYAVAALDTKCNVSIYDLDGNATKESAKILLLADPWLCEYGKFDIDTLFTLTGATIPVVSPQDLMFDSIFAGERKAFNVGIICDSTYVGTGIYPSIFRSKTAEHGLVGAHCFEGYGSLYGFLDEYIASGNTVPLDAILVDDPALDPAELDAELAAIRDFSREESMKYGKFVAPTLEISSSYILTMRECYRILRSGSLFTHKIARPDFKLYSVRPRPQPEGTEFLLIPVNDVQN
ncbi:MAG: hypothetical protein J5759_04485 [Bacteroidales bacterium]|nr:hypothetical protein [Bacteroidales bacterium]